MDSNNESVEYEEWLPKVLKRWDALIADTNRDARKYTAFLRFAFKSYDIPATAQVRKIRKGSSYHYALKIEYLGAARTMQDMRVKLAEIREIVWEFKRPAQFNIQYDYYKGGITYSPCLIWEQNERNGPTYFRNLMSVGKGDVPYLPSDIRTLIVGH